MILGAGRSVNSSISLAIPPFIERSRKGGENYIIENAIYGSRQLITAAKKISLGELEKK